MCTDGKISDFLFFKNYCISSQVHCNMHRDHCKQDGNLNMCVVYTLLIRRSRLLSLHEMHCYENFVTTQNYNVWKNLWFAKKTSFYYLQKLTFLRYWLGVMMNLISNVGYYCIKVLNTCLICYNLILCIELILKSNSLFKIHYTFTDFFIFLIT